MQIKLWVLCFVLLLAGCATGPQSLPAQDLAQGDEGPSVLTESYKMSVGDQVQVSVRNNPDLSVAEPVRPDGMIAVPLIGDVMAAGKKPEQLAADIKDRLTKYVKKPNVTVILTELQGQAFLSRIRITGSVENNISIPYAQGMTVLDAVLEAGSVTQFAAANRTKLHRRAGGEAKTYDIHLDDILKEGNMQTNVKLLPGDVITVPERLF